MRQAVITFAKGACLLFFLIIAQSLFGRWVIWSRAMPEGDFAYLILLSFSMGRVRGTFLGSLAGALRDTFSGHPFGLGLFVLAGVGFVSGILGERQRLRRPWQKMLFIFGALLISDSLFWVLRGGGSAIFSSGLVSYYLESVFPSATLTALIGLFMGYFL